MNKRFLAFPAAALVSVSLFAQEKPAGVKRVGTPVKVDVVIGRYQGEKRLSSMPYALLVSADDRPTVVRFGLQLPIQTMANNNLTIAFRDSGTTLDCTAETQDDGRFKLSLQVEQLAAFSGFDRKSLAGSSALANVPLQSMFKASNVMLLRDGQRVEWVAATDPTNGETLKIDVSLAVVK